MDLRQLRQFVAVAEELHFGRAAARLNMTQPPLSQAIQHLEAELGVELLARTKRSVALTPVGRQWLDEVRKVLGDAAALPDIARRLALGELGQLRLAFVSTADYSVLPGLVSRYRGVAPDVKVALREATSDIQIEALLNDEIDVGMIIAQAQSSMPPSLGYRPLMREPLVAAVPDAWVQEGRAGFTQGAVGAGTVVATPLILFPRRSAPGFHDAIVDYYVQNGFRPTIVQEAIQMQTIIGLVAAGLGMALVPQSLTNLNRAGARYLPLAGGAPLIETGLIWRSEDRSPTLQRFLDIAGGLGPAV
ncbi:LysR family transcriptional regulator [Phreatobacter sp. AB_2022a]|uniref:LysR family transcriptional regulator n=1 Tax=Phreatobacter sp. AB_2022a TaxID=3003134 RepID=UPI00228718A7|nr:LysR family transcriptional regulator [Phreatobacter sp. AB_2022a]MCZ0738830.1 LysR family transcriptional regulator [Phreatobacter sp. AB_2022a]